MPLFTWTKLEWGTPRAEGHIIFDAQPNNLHWAYYVSTPD